jgi:hypothetical protein
MAANVAGWEDRRLMKSTHRLITALALLAALTPCSRAVEGIINADSSLTIATPTRLQGKSPKLAVSKAGSSVVQFSLESLPDGADGAQVRKAVLKLFVQKVIKPGTLRLSGTDLTAALEETTLNGATNLSDGVITPLMTTSVVAADARQWVAFDVTDYLRSRLNAGSTLATFGLSHDGNDGNLLNVAFDSKETPSTSHAPVLDIVLGEGTVTPITVASVSQDGSIRAISGEPIVFTHPAPGQYGIASIPTSASPSQRYSIVVTPYPGPGQNFTASVRSTGNGPFGMMVETRNNGTLADSIFFISVWRHPLPVQ